MSARTKARKRALDMLYSADMRQVPVEQMLVVEAQKAANEPERAASWLYAREIVDGIFPAAARGAPRRRAWRFAVNGDRMRRNTSTRFIDPPTDCLDPRQTQKAQAQSVSSGVIHMFQVECRCLVLTRSPACGTVTERAL